MTDDEQTMERLNDLGERRRERREFFRALAGVAGFAGGLSMAGGAAAQTATIGDPEILNFALNLEYLEAQFYAFAANGQGLANADLTGLGVQGAVTGGRRVNFQDPIIAQYAREIAADELAHVRFLRTAIGTTATVSQPAIDIGTDPNGAFSSAARAAGLVGPGQSFDPYASDEAFLLGAFIFEDVGVTAYKGAAPLISSKVFLEAAAGLLAVEAYHAAIVRTALYARGIQTPPPAASNDPIGAANAISTARDSLDGASDIDQGISPIVTPAGTASNIVPLDGNGLAYSRTTGQVLNIVYLRNTAVDRGGFFPNGVNGTIRTSAAN